MNLCVFYVLHKRIETCGNFHPMLEANVSVRFVELDFLSFRFLRQAIYLTYGKNDQLIMTSEIKLVSKAFSECFCIF